MGSTLNNLGFLLGREGKQEEALVKYQLAVEHSAQAYEREPHSLRVLINPVMTLVGDETTDFFEGCLSIKGYTAMVTRHRAVAVSYLDERGETQEWRPRGWQARVTQHEYDHLERVLYTDKMLPKSFMSTEEFKARHATKLIADLKQELGIV